MKEQRLLKIFTYFSVLAIIISCLGLMGLAMFTNELKVKEIGVRKTLGASNREIVRLLLGGFVVVIMIANVFAWPASYYLVSRWLTDFAYRTDITIGPFIAGAGITLLIALGTIALFAIRASRGDIVKALKYE